MGTWVNRPSPAMIVAIIALIAALTGTAFAALGKNTVGTKQLKKNAVTAAKIKKNAVTTAKIKNAAVTGDKVNEATLGPVPNAVKATTATNATTATSAATAGSANSLAGYKPFGVFVGPGLHDIASFGPFLIKAECVINNAGTDEGEMQLYTSVDGAAMDDNNGDEFTPFDTIDNPANLYYESTTTGEEDIEVSEEPGLTAVAPGGPTVILQNETIGFNIAGHPGQCYFAGVALQG
jgi:hypothetical protein